jgi:hypothetical protein
LACRVCEHPCPETIPRHCDDADGLQRESYSTGPCPLARPAQTVLHIHVSLPGLPTDGSPRLAAFSSMPPFLVGVGRPETAMADDGGGIGKNAFWTLAADRLAACEEIQRLQGRPAASNCELAALIDGRPRTTLLPGPCPSTPPRRKEPSSSGFGEFVRRAAAWSESRKLGKHRLVRV